MTESTPGDRTDEPTSVESAATDGGSGPDPQRQVVPRPNAPLPQPGGHSTEIVEGTIVDRPIPGPRRTNRRLLLGLAAAVVVLLLVVGLLVTLLVRQRTITATPHATPSATPSQTPSAKASPSDDAGSTPSPDVASTGPSPAVSNPNVSPQPSASGATAIVAGGGFGPYFFSDLGPVGRTASYNTGSVSFGSAIYPHAVSMYCNGSASYIDYDVGGRTGKLTGTFGVSNDAPGAVGQTATVTFYDQDRNQVGRAKTLSLGHPVTFTATVSASVVRLRATCTSTGGFYVSLGDLKMVP